MGAVADYMRALLTRQLDEHRRPLIWFDPEQHYATFAGTLELPDTEIARYEGSFMALRQRIEPLISQDDPPRLLVYVPIGEDESQHALIELTAAGIVVKPGQNPLQRNTRLGVVARRALRQSLGPAKAEEVARQVDAGQLSFADLDEIQDKYGESPVLLSIFKSGQAETIALELLSSEKFDPDVVARTALGELIAVLGTTFGIALEAATTPVEVREQLARHIILTEFVASAHPPLPQALSSLKTASAAIARQACVDLARTWRLRRDLAHSYAAHASSTEGALGLDNVPLSIAQVGDCETFAGVERALQERVGEALQADAPAWEALLELAVRRQASYWSDRMAELQAHWALIVTAGRLLEEAQRIEAELKHAPSDPGALLRAYGEGERPWCLLDTYQRNLERRWHAFDPGQDARHLVLERLVARARQRYMDVGGTLAERYVHALAGSKGSVSGVRRQIDTYATAVRPVLARKTAYVLVDALRFEMARELMAGLVGDYAIELSLVAATVPTITEIGMASLMPGAEVGVQVEPAAEGKLGLRLGGTLLKDRKGRIEWFHKQHQGKVADTTMEEVLPKPKRSLQATLEQADVILVTSREIDLLCESDNIPLARKTMDDVLPELSRLVHRLRDLDCATIVIAADHGYLFGDEVDSDMKLDPPGGQTVDLHRRVWVGRGGAADPAFFRVPLARFGLSDDLDLATPWGFGVFRTQGGARAYFHGGLSPQEMAIPVMVITPRVTLAPEQGATTWRIIPGSKKISTRFLSVQVAGSGAGLFGLSPSRVRVEVRSSEGSAKGKLISQSISASYGFIEATGAVEMRLEPESQELDANTVTLMITDPAAKAVVGVHLVDELTGRELADPLQLDMTIAM